MCMDCGCMMPHDRMGDERNITWEDIEAAAEANDITPDEAMDNIMRTYEVVKQERAA